jgi:hypothetical protein
MACQTLLRVPISIPRRTFEMSVALDSEDTNEI